MAVRFPPRHHHSFRLLIVAITAPRARPKILELVFLRHGDLDLYLRLFILAADGCRWFLGEVPARADLRKCVSESSARLYADLGAAEAPFDPS